jgi:hypothetical protein
MSDNKNVGTYAPIIVAIIAAVGVGEGVDFGQDYSEDIRKNQEKLDQAAEDRQYIREEMQYLWEESDWNYQDIETLYIMMCDDGYKKACEYWYGE